MKKVFDFVVVKHVLVACAAAGLMVLAGCGGDEDACADVDCAFGVCDGSSGQCINPDNCEIDDDCVPGFECGANYVCEAVDTCSSDGDCAAGVCSEGACVNPESCETHDDCLDRTYCGFDDTCRADPCNDISCARGVCDRGTDNCVSADSCTVETQATDCIDGEKCADGTCKPQTTFCEDLECERGVCSYDEGGCVSADNCEGDDANCVEGEFCNDQDECRADKCIEDDVDCGDEGVCQPATGECENAITCESNSDCTADHLCVENTCTLESGACGDADGDGGCPGNRVCEYDEDAMTTECTEPDFCDTSIDCDDGRQCGGSSCLDAVTCTDDVFETNDTVEDATDIVSMSSDNSVSASLCDGDTDFYAFASGDLIDEITDGELLVEVDVPARDRGLGELEVVVTDEDGNELSDTTDATGHARVQRNLRIIEHGDFTVEVRGADGVTAAGVRYDLSLNFLPTETVDACDDATMLPLDQTLVGNTQDALSTAMGSSCTTVDNPSSELVYAITLDAPQEVTFIAEPILSATHLSLSLRSRCTQANTEQACANDVAAGESQDLTAVLDRGTHYLVVQAPEGGDGGQFELSASSSGLTCASDYCADANTSNVCSPTGTRYTETTCDLGCVPTTGRCNPTQGNTCMDAELLDTEGVYGFDLLQLEDEYDGAQAGCVGSRTDGPDQSFEVEVPAQTVLTATVNFANEVDGSAYLVEDCADIGSSCVEGVTDSTDTNAEEVIFANDTDNPRSLKLIVDTAADQLFGSGDVEIAFTDIICEPGTTICSGDAVDICNSLGTDYDEDDVCSPWACDSGSCQRPNTCADAVDVTAQAAQSGGYTLSDDWDNYTADYDGAYCGLASGTWDRSTGEDLVFSVDLNAFDILDVNITNSITYMYPGIAIVSDCTTPDAACLETDTGSGGTRASTYQALTDETVFVMIDNESTTGNSFDLTIETSPGCDPTGGNETCQGDDVEYCGGDGLPGTYTCSVGTCASGTCDTETGDFCFDAEDLTTAAAQTGGTTKTLDWAMYNNDLDSAVCGLDASDVDGDDAYFKFDLQQDEILKAKLDPGTSSADPSLLVTSNCTGPDLHCGDSHAESGAPAEVAYRATSAETVYLIAASDTVGGSDDFTLDVEIIDAECDPAAASSSCIDSGTVEECVEPGMWETRSCSCSSGVCLDGQSCAGAIPLGHGDSDVQTFTGTNIMSPGQGTVGSCNFTSSNEPLGPDHIYAIDLLANETLTVDYSTGINELGSSFGVMYILETCTDINSCQVNGGTYPTSGGTLTYTAAQDGTYYLVVERNLSGSASGYDYQVDIDIQ